ncbi:MAG: protein kinase [Planctomycetota bacterium]
MKLRHDLIGSQLGNYKIERLLGEGGMGAVYRARDMALDRDVAVKVIRKELTEDPAFVERFHREAKVAARFQHPNSIAIYHYDDGSGGSDRLFMVYEFVKGRELRSMIDQGPLSPVFVTKVAIQALSALEAAHRAGIVHRDLKPQNVMVAGDQDSPEIKILDFGIAKLKDHPALTQAGQVMGTLAFMSPEQTMGKEVDARSDIYSMGVLLFMCLTGKLPFHGKTAGELMDHHRKTAPPRMASVHTGVPAALEPIVAKSLAKDPDERYQTAREFRQALEAIPQEVLSFAQAATVNLENSLEETKGRPPITDPVATAFHDTAGALAEKHRTASLGGYSEGDTGEFFGGLVGRTVAGKYLIEDKLGQGGMGAVFKALHQDLKRHVALKIVHPAVADRHDVHERFQREARAAMGFIHPNAIPTRDFGRTEAGLLYMTQDFSPGQDLDKLLKEHGRMPVDRALGIVRQVLLALSEAHKKSIVHRDLKPANILLEDGDLVRVTDFGIAKILEEEPSEKGTASELTGNQVIGTPFYMAPEQARGQQIDLRTDIYAMGCVLYELLTATRPFSGDSALDVLMKQAHKEVEPPRQRAPKAGIPAEVEGIVLKAMAKAREERFQDADAFIAAIDAALSGAPVPDVTLPPSTVPTPSGGGMLVPMAGFCALVLAALIVVTLVVDGEKLPKPLAWVKTKLETDSGLVGQTDEPDLPPPPEGTLPPDEPETPDPGETTPPEQPPTPPVVDPNPPTDPGETTPPSDPGETDPGETTPPSDPGETDPGETTPPSDPGETDPGETTPPSDPGETDPGETTPPSDPGETDPPVETPPVDVDPVGTPGPSDPGETTPPSDPETPPSDPGETTPPAVDPTPPVVDPTPPREPETPPPSDPETPPPSDPETPPSDPGETTPPSDPGETAPAVQDPPTTNPIPEAEPWVEPPPEDRPPVDPYGSGSGRNTTSPNTDTGRTTQPRSEQPRRPTDGDRQVVTREGLNFEYQKVGGVWLSTQTVTWRAALVAAVKLTHLRDTLKTLAPAELRDAMPWGRRLRRGGVPREQADGTALLRYLEGKGVGAILDSPIQGLSHLHANQIAGHFGARLPTAAELDRAPPICTLTFCDEAQVAERVSAAGVRFTTLAKLGRSGARDVEVRLALP